MSIFSKKKPTAITQKNIEESREEILAKGKKFRYPFQYAKHRLVITAILIAVVAIVAFVGLGWLELYKVQNTGEVVYRFTRVIPVPVASVDGHNVRYSDYLMLYRSSVQAIEYQQGKFDDSEDAKSQLAHYQRRALSEAEEYTYAMARLDEMGLAVTDEEIDELVEEHKMVDGERRDDSVFEGVVRDNFGLSMREYRRLLELSLARKKVAEEMDVQAKQLAESIRAGLAENGGDMAAIVEAYADNELVSYEQTGDAVSVSNLDGGRAAQAAALEENGAISDYFVSKNGDGYYIVKLSSKKDGRVSYESIWIRFAEFEKALDGVRDAGGIKEYISLE